MKKIVVFLALLDLKVACSQPENVPRATPEQAANFALENPFRFLSMELPGKKVLSSDSVFYFARTIEIHTLLPDSNLFLVITGRDNVTNVTFVQKTKNAPHFTKVTSEEEREKLYQQRISNVGRSLSNKPSDLLTTGTLLKHTSNIVVHMPKYEESVFLVLTSKDGLRDDLYAQDMKNRRNFSRVVFQWDNTPFKLDLLLGSDDGPGREKYYIDCSIGTRIVFSPVYDISKREVVIEEEPEE